jgi:hypothetical protein
LAWTIIVGAILLEAGRARSTVVVLEPQAQLLRRSDIIAVVHVDTVVGAPPLTNGHAPDVVVTVRDSIKGCRPGDVLTIQRWVTGRPWSDALGFTSREDSRRRWESAPTSPPSPRSEILVCLKRVGDGQAEQIQSTEGPVFLSSPKAQQVAVVRGTTWLEFHVDSLPSFQEPMHPYAVSGTLWNRSSQAIEFNLRNARIVGVEMPTGLGPEERWSAHPPPPTKVDGGAHVPYFFFVDWVSSVPIGFPGTYRYDLELPAEVTGPPRIAQEGVSLGEAFGAGHVLHAEFKLLGAPNLHEVARASWAVCTATIDSILPLAANARAPRQVSLIDRRWLLSGPPDATVFTDWPATLPLKPTLGGRYIVFFNRAGQVFYVAEVNKTSLLWVEGALRWVEQNR